MIPLIFMGGWTGYGIYQAASVLVPVGFLKFSRAMESEADLLGLEYMYKAGYDPTAFVDFFEKIETLEKRKPGTMAKVFSTHPPTDARIQAAQKNIQEYLKAKPEYVLTTSEFNDVKGAFARRCTTSARSITRPMRIVPRCAARLDRAPERWAPMKMAESPGIR